MATLYDRCWVTSSTNGSGSFTLTGAVPGFRALYPTVPDGSLVSYIAYEVSDQAWEIGTGTTGSSGTTLTRNFTESSTGSGISFNGGATVALTARAADILNPANNLSDLASPPAARTNLGLLSMAQQASGAVAITGGSVAGTSITLSTGSAAVSGRVWYDSGQQTLAAYEAGAESYKSGTLYSMYGSLTSAISGTANIFYNSGTGYVGTPTIPANFFIPGKLLRLTLFGTIQTGSIPGTLSLSVTIGSVTGAASVSGVAVATGSSSGLFNLEIIMSCDSVGVSGGVSTSTLNLFAPAISSGAIGSIAPQALNATINTTISNQIGIFATNSALGNTLIAIDAAVMEALN